MSRTLEVLQIGRSHSLAARHQCHLLAPQGLCESCLPHLARPVEQGPWPGLVFYSDIYQLGDPMLRLANRLAGYGFVVAAPEIFHRLEPVGTVIEPDAIGRLRGNDAARRTEIAAYDADAEALLSWLRD